MKFAALPASKKAKPKKRDLRQVQAAVDELVAIREELRRSGMKPLTYREIREAICTGRR